jgi:hypothetical protein
VLELRSAARQSEGNGLGLDCREIVHGHGGTIQYRSSSVSGRSGTIFHISLPTQSLVQHTLREEANLKLDPVVTDLLGLSGRRLRTVLIQCSWAAARTKGSYFQSLYHCLRSQRGAEKAIGAVAASLLATNYHMLKNGTLHEDLGANYFDHNAKRDRRCA